VRQVLTHCGKNLIDLKLSHCKQLSSATFTQALRVLPHLETLAVPGCPNFDAPVLRYLACSLLFAFALKETTDQVMVVMVMVVVPRQAPELCPSLSKIVTGREGISKLTKTEVMEQHPGLEIM
jgi:hypothetical protein